MHAMKRDIVPENRQGVDYYLSKVWMIGFELCSSLRYSPELPEGFADKFTKYVSFEEARIRKNLEDLNYDIDALETVYIVVGPGRVEKVPFKDRGRMSC